MGAAGPPSSAPPGPRGDAPGAFGRGGPPAPAGGKGGRRGGHGGEGGAGEVRRRAVRVAGELDGGLGVGQEMGGRAVEAGHGGAGRFGDVREARWAGQSGFIGTPGWAWALRRLDWLAETRQLELQKIFVIDWTCDVPAKRRSLGFMESPVV